MLKIPVVTPLAIEGGKTLIDMVGENNNLLPPEIIEATEKMREDIKSRLGVSIPGIRFRKNTEHASNEYSLLINEIILKNGTIDGEGLIFIDNLVLEIQDIIEDNLSVFIGHQYVDIMIDDLLKTTTIDTPDIKELSDFTSLLKIMIEDRIPITDLEEILQEFMKSIEKQLNINEVYENIRMLKNIRGKLPGNNNWHKFYTLTPKLEKIFESCIVDLGFKQELDLDETAILPFLEPIREKVRDRRILAIIVKNHSIRRVIQQIVHLEFPNVPVLSRNELLEHLQDFIKGTLI